MPKREDIYIITDENVLPSLPPEMSSSGIQREARSAGPRSADRIRYRQPASAAGRAPKASSLSLFVWGAGQIYNDQRELGALMLLTQVFAIAAHWCLLRVWPSLREMAELLGVSEWRLMAGVAIADFLLVIIMVGNVYQAYRHAELESGEYEGSSNPILSGLASLLIPGWGQILNAQAGKAAVFLFLLLSSLYLVGLVLFTPFLRLLATVDPGSILLSHMDASTIGVLGVAAMMWVLSVYDAVLVAGFRRRMA